MFQAATGDTVKVHYTGKLADGTVFDTSRDKAPLHFILGKEEVIPGFESAVVGMVQGESKTVTVPADQAYGPHKQELVEKVDREILPADLNLQVGAQLEATMEDGSLLRVMVNDLSETQVTLDANHPLAGRELIFEIEMVEVNKKPAA